jgi:NADH-quinone oxidoreductase subunit J
MTSIHSLLLFLFILFSILTITSNNPIFSIIFLIFTFCCASIILIVFNIEFLSALFVIIYVGAIAVLFLFVIMMLNIKIYPFKNSAFFFFIPILNILNFLILNEFCILFEEVFLDVKIIFNNISINHETLSVMSTYGQTLYNYFLICILIAGLILLVSMIGSISLALTFKSQKISEMSFKQLIKHSHTTLW